MGLITKKEYEIKFDENQVNELIDKRELKGIWCCWNHEKRPIKLPDTNFVINWSFSQTKAEFYFSSEEKKLFLIMYIGLMYYGEWGSLCEKPIIFMEIISSNLHIKSKTPFPVNDILKILKKKKNINLNIYFQSVITKDPESEEYEKKKQSMTIAHRGFILLNWHRLIRGDHNRKCRINHWKRR